MNKIINGNFNSALCHIVNADDSIALETYTIAQIKALCDKEIYKNAKIVMMPDAHPGKVGPIGLTMEIDRETPIMPALIGNDIGCGMSMVKFIPKHKLTASDFKKLDIVLRSDIKNKDSAETILDYSMSDTYDIVNIKAAEKNLGTLGGGNHFIEIDTDENGEYYLTVHSGSRSVGNDIYKYYMDLGRKKLSDDGINIPYEDTYLYNYEDYSYGNLDIAGYLILKYVVDSNVCVRYAKCNRETIVNNIMREMKWKVDNDFKPLDVPHNYIDTSDENKYIIHKGSISAKKGEPVIIPINMRDGIILGYGKGNSEWNCSAPHGSGRIIKRSEVKNSVTLNMFKKSMEGIYSPSISSNTLDESPFAYRNIDLIKEAISDTVEITNVLKPVYNFKNGGNE